eukprot:SAG31_NODE_1235_length_9198_cov_5.065282_7_plen_160_part_00
MKVPAASPPPAAAVSRRSSEAAGSACHGPGSATARRAARGGGNRFTGFRLQKRQGAQARGGRSQQPALLTPPPRAPAGMDPEGQSHHRHQVVPRAATVRYFRGNVSPQDLASPAHRAALSDEAAPLKTLQSGARRRKLKGAAKLKSSCHSPMGLPVRLI